MSKLGIVSDEQFNLELANCSIQSNPRENTRAIHPSVSIEPNHSRGLIEPSVRAGRKIGDNNVPESLRNLIADEHLTKGRESAVALAKEFNISESSVSAYAKGTTSTTSYDNPDKTLSNYLAARKNRITKKALRVITASVDRITPEKLDDLSPNKLAVLSKDLATVDKSMEPDKDSVKDSNQPKFVIYAPTVRDERTYETIVVNDNY